MKWIVGLGMVAACCGMEASAMVTAYDDDGMITVDGKRKLIIGSYYYTVNGMDRPPEVGLEELAEAGFNLVRTGSDPAIMDKAQAAGLMTWVGIGTVKLDNLEGSSASLLERVNAVKDHPALAFMESVDEPAWEWMTANQRVPAEAFATAYPLIKQADPNHLLYMNHAPTNLVKTMRPYNAGTDIVAMDIYPVNPGGIVHQFALFEDGHQGDLNNMTISQVGEYVDKMRQVTGPDRPLFMVLQAFAWEKLVNKDKFQQRDEKILYPTYGQTRFMAFQALIKGANGIIYWGSGYTPQPSDCWTGVKRVAREIADLSGPLAERTASIDLAADYHEMGHSVDDGVQTLAKEHEGRLYLFTCNADRYRCKATLSGVGSAYTSCTVVNEDRTLPIEADGVTDVWDRFEVHIYELGQ